LTDSGLLILGADLFTTFAIYLVITLGLNLENGYAGIPNFGKVLAVAGGAFVAGFFPGRLMAYLMGFDTGIGYINDNDRIVTLITRALENDLLLSIALFTATLIVAAAVGAILGLIASYPAIRLREDYLAMTLLAMGEGMRIIGQNYYPLVGGSRSVSVPNPFAYFGDSRYSMIMFGFLVIALLAMAYLERLIRSPLGRVLRAMRDDEVAASSLGKDAVRLRMKVLAVGSALGAIGGALYVFYTCNCSAAAYNRFDWTFWPWVAMMLGGAANNIGVALGVLVFVATRQGITLFKGQIAPYVPFDPVWLEPLLFGSALILILMFRPDGILPEKPTHTITPTQVKVRPKDLKAIMKRITELPVSIFNKLKRALLRHS
jgi:branched-chain amino acid transport system permease protein